MAKDMITNELGKDNPASMPTNLNSSKDSTEKLPDLNEFLTGLEKQVKQNKVKDKAVFTDEFFEFKEKNIPTPEEFGLTFENETANMPPMPEVLPQSNEKKPGFLKKLFSKKEKNDVSEALNQDFSGLKNDFPEISQEETPRVFDKPRNDSPVILFKKEKTNKTEKKLTDNRPVLPNVFKIKEKNEKKRELHRKIKEINDIHKELKGRQKESEDKLLKLKKLKESLDEKERILDVDRKELNQKLSEAKTLEIAQRKRMSDFEAKFKDVADLKELLLAKEKAIILQKESINNEKIRIKELKENSLKEEIAKAKAQGAKSKELAETLSQKISEINSDVKASEKKKNSIFEKERKISKLEMQAIEKEKILDSDRKELNQKLSEAKTLKLSQIKMLLGFEAKFLGLDEFKESLLAKEKAFFLNKESLKNEISKSGALSSRLKGMSDALSQKIREIKDISQSLEEKKKLINKKEKDLALSEKAVKQKNSLLKSYPSKMRFMEKKEKGLSRKEQLLKTKDENLKKLALTLKNKEAELAQSKNAFDKSLLMYSKEKEEIEDEEFRDYLNKKLSEIAGKKDASNEEAPQKKDKEQALSDLLRECKNHIRIRNFEEAKKLYNKIRLSYYNADIPSENKEALYNQIRTLYDDINLGMLSR